MMLGDAQGCIMQHLYYQWTGLAVRQKSLPSMTFIENLVPLLGLDFPSLPSEGQNQNHVSLSRACTRYKVSSVTSTFRLPMVDLYLSDKAQ